MPNRILRDWTDSEKIDSLSVNAERFFTRLIMKVDDYGRYNANLKFLKSTLFPLKTDIRESDITRWLTECENSGLIVLYNVASKDYVQIENFKQVLRQKVIKYPPPEMLSTCVADAKHTTSNCLSSASLNRIESESESESESEFEGEKFFLIPEMGRIFKAENPNYISSQEHDFPALKSFAEFISEKKYETKNFSSLKKPQQLEIAENFKKVAVWYKDKGKGKSLSNLARWQIQEVFNQINAQRTSENYMDRKNAELNNVMAGALQILKSKQDQY